MPSLGMSPPKLDCWSLNSKSSCRLSLVYTLMSHLIDVIKAIKAINALAFFNIFYSSYTTSDFQLKQKQSYTWINVKN